MIICGDALAELRKIPSDSVHCCITSPPYWGLRDYKIEPQIWDGSRDCDHEWGGKVSKPGLRGGRNQDGKAEDPTGTTFRSFQTSKSQFCSKCGAWLGSFGLEPGPDLYIKHLTEIFEEVRRVLRKDGTLWMNIGDCYATGAGRVGEHPGGGTQGERWRGDEKRNSNRRALQMGPMTQPNRMPIPGLKPKDMVGIPWRAAFALQAAGWYLRSDIIWSKPNPMPESVLDRPTKSHEYIFLLTKSGKYFYDADAIREKDSRAEVDSRLFRGGQMRDSKLGSFGLTRGKSNQSCTHPAGKNKRTVWTISPQAFMGAHFATFPYRLVKPCLLAGCPEGGTVLDPFLGSGTVGIMARRFGRQLIGIELNPEYAEMARRRLERVQPLFRGVEPLED